jgi:hypothetical protein
MVDPLIGKDGHLTVEAMDLYVLRRLHRDEADCVGHHVRRCEQCRISLRDLGLVVAALRGQMPAGRRRLCFHN